MHIKRRLDNPAYRARLAYLKGQMNAERASRAAVILDGVGCSKAWLIEQGKRVYVTAMGELPHIAPLLPDKDSPQPLPGSTLPTVLVKKTNLSAAVRAIQVLSDLVDGIALEAEGADAIGEAIRQARAAQQAARMN